MVPRRLSQLASSVLLALGLTLVGGAPSRAQIVEHATMTVRGGMAIDAWGEISTPNAFVEGDLIIRIPSGATVMQAWLFSATRSGTSDPTLPTTDPPKTVLVGTGATATSRDLVGTPDRPSPPSLPGFGVWITDVTTAVADSLSGGGDRVRIQERGDPADSFASIAQYIHGHVLVVVYESSTAPMRHISIFGATPDNDFAGQVWLAGPHQPCDPSDPGAEPVVLSVTYVSELTGCEEANVVTVGSSTISDAGGGADDWPRDTLTSGDPCPGPPWQRGGLITAGSFGAMEGASGRDFPVGTDGDSLDGTGGRLDDELYDISDAIAEGSMNIPIDFDIRTNTSLTSENVLVPVIALQAVVAGAEGSPQRARTCDLVGSAMDGGVGGDGGTSSDGGAGDSGSAGDASRFDTGGALADGSTTSADLTFTGGGGCACRGAGSRSGAPWWALLVLAIWVVGRSRRHPPC